MPELKAHAPAVGADMRGLAGHEGQVDPGGPQPTRNVDVAAGIAEAGSGPRVDGEVETKIDQNRFLAGQLREWDQSGSEVIRGPAARACRSTGGRAWKPAPRFETSPAWRDVADGARWGKPCQRCRPARRGPAASTPRLIVRVSADVDYGRNGSAAATLAAVRASGGLNPSVTCLRPRRAISD